MSRPERKHEGEANLTAEQAFGVAMRRIRLKRGLSQQSLADRSGYHRTYIGLLESGQKSPSLRTVFNLGITLGVRPSEILRTVERLIRHTEH